MAFLKRGITTDLEMVKICSKCSNPKEKCICNLKEEKGEKNGVYKESNNNRKFLHRKSA
jgi:DTW domain-containing protein YfiP